MSSLKSLPYLNLFNLILSYREALWCSGLHTRFRIHDHGFESEHRLFSHHSASAFSKLRSLAKCSLDDSVRRLL